MTPLRVQALLEPEDSSSSDFVESPEESSPEVSDSDGGNIQSGADAPTVTSDASGELDTTGEQAKPPGTQRTARSCTIHYLPIVHKTQARKEPALPAPPAQARSRADKQPKGQAGVQDLLKQSSNKQQEHAGGIKSLRRDTRRQPTDQHPLATFFVEAHDFVHNERAILYRRVKAPAPAADGAAIPPAPAAMPDDAGRPPASVVHIPGLRALVDSSHEHFIPPPAQRNVTPLVMRVFPRHVHARAALTDQQRDILTLHSRRTHSLKSQDRVLQSTIFAHFPERDLSHSPMRVSSYYPLKAFPHRYAQMLDCYLHGMPICQCPTECDGCQRELDPSVAAHHLQTCKRRSSKLPTAHDNLTRTIRSMLNEAGLQSVIDTVGDPRSRRQVPSHPHGRKMKGDIHIPGIRDRGPEQYEGLMADVTLVHPYIGSSADLTKWGEVNLDALHVAASEKIRKHRAAYAMTTPPRAFIPLAISTDALNAS
ncbi:hypothetical protein GUITHDRAFT_110687 [Guillardia theta CCMP2712]|uniref:Uncharacterized protein n=1 Tax=Guillardia theta (strain CCMP2712) TaxID=905079 RepID=L1J4P3_GUITC|nr:hypothetical protein GUITHDRAFT_110687 [Guillardia theta CCMP2712]EKX43272.1 hypothetical protein GUITHDRAFT_110687 [Guillardia theta CCMP2712]|eukprot:XP_005830252.1 hypothetical protein GUITHDRAFT_110687 [Guillardia theta CCMP2712]